MYYPFISALLLTAFAYALECVVTTTSILYGFASGGLNGVNGIGGNGNSANGTNPDTSGASTTESINSKCSSIVNGFCIANGYRTNGNLAALGTFNSAQDINSCLRLYCVTNPSCKAVDFNIASGTCTVITSSVSPDDLISDATHNAAYSAAGVSADITGGASAVIGAAASAAGIISSGLGAASTQSPTNTDDGAAEGAALTAGASGVVEVASEFANVVTIPPSIASSASLGAGVSLAIPIPATATGAVAANLPVPLASIVTVKPDTASQLGLPAGVLSIALLPASITAVIAVSAGGNGRPLSSITDMETMPSMVPTTVLTTLPTSTLSTPTLPGTSLTSTQVSSSPSPTGSVLPGTVQDDCVPSTAVVGFCIAVNSGATALVDASTISTSTQASAEACAQECADLAECESAVFEVLVSISLIPNCLLYATVSVDSSLISIPGQTLIVRASGSVGPQGMTPF